MSMTPDRNGQSGHNPSKPIFFIEDDESMRAGFKGMLES